MVSEGRVDRQIYFKMCQRNAEEPVNTSRDHVDKLTEKFIAMEMIDPKSKMFSRWASDFFFLFII